MGIEDYMDDVEDLEPLTALAEELGVDLPKMRRWADAERHNNFPQPVERIGRVKFYRRAEVVRWYRLWSKTKQSGVQNG